VAELDVLSVSADGSVTARQPLMIQRFAKRRYHRTPVDLPLVIGETACRAIDLSGCGLLAQAPKGAGIMKQDIVSATLFLETGAPIPLTMYVVRAGDGPEGRLLGFDFMEVKEMDQDRIIAYVLRQERKRLQAMRKL
jgi:c-di-GMP-binding flagellar brake protein YcgR